jgi:hypothetical protein
MPSMGYKIKGQDLPNLTRFIRKRFSNKKA